MIEGSSSPFLYLDSEDYKSIHEHLARWAALQGEPVPPFELAKHEDLASLVDLPQQSFYGNAAYRTLAEKAAIIFYTINKKQMFLNGNKRMSTLSLLIFLNINGKMLDVSSDELTTKALWLAKTESLQFPAIKQELVGWIESHLQRYPVDKAA